MEAQAANHRPGQSVAPTLCRGLREGDSYKRKESRQGQKAEKELSRIRKELNEDPQRWAYSRSAAFCPLSNACGLPMSAS